MLTILNFCYIVCLTIVLCPVGCDEPGAEIKEMITSGDRKHCDPGAPSVRVGRLRIDCSGSSSVVAVWLLLKVERLWNDMFKCFLLFSGGFVASREVAN